MVTSLPTSMVLTACLFAQPVSELSAEVCVIGGGSGGIGAALGAARAGADVILIEREQLLGGTSTNALVSNWEPGPGEAFAREMYDRLAKLPNAVGITTDRNPERKLGPFGLWMIDPNLRYDQTLRRAGLPRSQCHAVVFEPEAFHQVVMEMLSETTRCRVLLGTTFTKAEAEGRRVRSITVKLADGPACRIRADVFIDSTGNAYLCRDLGCQTMLGGESREQFAEPSAPEKADQSLNAISLCYRISKRAKPAPQPSSELPLEGWTRSAHVFQIPSGDLIVNPLGLLPGRALIDMGYDKALEESKRRVQAHWQWLRSYPTFVGYEFDGFATMLGVRESFRVVGEYVLTENDLLAGLAGQQHRDIIALADHPRDVHGAGGRTRELPGPYGIPYRCLIPKGWENLLIACRAASFSQIAASSCRLSRTMIALGHAAGVGAAMAARGNVPVGQIDMPELRKQLGL